jgi:hypothetical protein
MKNKLEEERMNSGGAQLTIKINNEFRALSHIAGSKEYG